MSIFQKIFGAPQSAQQQAVTNNPATNPPPSGTHESQQTAPNGQVPAGATEPPKDKFETLWETVAPSKEEESRQQQNTLTPEEMMEAAGKVDFTKTIDPALIQKVVAGGEEAITALTALLNKNSQTVYAQATVVAQKLIEQQVNAAKEEFASQVPNMVKRQNMQETLLAENPAFKKPSVAPVVSAIQKQLATKYPQASAAELNDMAREYMREAAQAFAPTPTPNKKSTKPDDIDWDAELGIGAL